MPIRPLALVAVALALAACGTSGDADGAPAVVDGATVVVGTAPTPDGATGSLGDAVGVAAGAPADAEDLACAADREALELAVETYELLNGAAPIDQMTLVTDQLIREPSPRFEVTGGRVVPAPGSPCP